jgi:L-alanine-DL-glutamate epimerase-like enolase superfamily enzyme
MKITDVTLTLFSWESIPSTIYGHHTARPSGKSDLGLLAVSTDDGITGHAFLGTSSNPASLDGPGLIRFLKPILMGQNPLDRERLNRLLWARARAATVRAIGACDVALWDIAGKAASLPIHRLIGTSRDSIPAYASSEIHAAPEAYVEQARHYQSTGWRAYKIQPFTADEVMFNWDYASDPATAATTIGSYQDVEVEKLDSFTVRVRFEKPTPFGGSCERPDYPQTPLRAI